jgi:hypothetical protein
MTVLSRAPCKTKLSLRNVFGSPLVCRMREDEYEDSIMDVQLRQIELDVCCL